MVGTDVVPNRMAAGENESERGKQTETAFLARFLSGTVNNKRD